jgi:short-subunit dehydrogenase
VGKRKKEKLPANHAFMSRKVLIIGGSSGLGRQLAMRFARNGDAVAVVARRGQLLTELKLEIPSIIIRQADIRDEKITDIMGQLFAEMNGLDILIVAASIVQFSNELTATSETDTVATNVGGFYNIICTAWQYLKSTGGGQIVGITSIAAARGNKQAPAYHASKSFQSSFLESLRVKARHEKNRITVTELIPGYMDTAMGKGDRLFWIVSPEKAARLAFRAINNKKKRAFIPGRWWWTWKIQRMMPIFLYDKIVNAKWKLKKR